MTKINLIFGEAIEEMSKLKSNSVDLILADVPYGTTACKWDTIIPFEKMWEQLKRIIKLNNAVLIFGQEPFSSYLRVSNVDQFKYDWQWRKSRPAGFTNAKLKPLKDLEVVSVFSSGATANGSSRNMPYNPQGIEDCEIDWERPTTYLGGDKGVNPARKNSKLKRVITKKNYPRQVLDFANPNNNKVHPTQKPVALMEYLIKTYTNEGGAVLDFTCGSGSTLVACQNLSRNGIGIDNGYCEKNKIVKGIQIKGLKWVEISQLRLDGKI